MNELMKLKKKLKGRKHIGVFSECPIIAGCTSNIVGAQSNNH